MTVLQGKSYEGRLWLAPFLLVVLFVSWLALFGMRGSETVAQTLFQFYELPRMSLALICGAAMGLAGFLIQQVIRNPFASPSTLGINAGALLGVTVVLSMTQSFSYATIGGLIGGLIAGGTTLGLAKRLGGSPVHMVLIGMIINLSLNGFAAILLLMFENSLDGLYVWGAGNLHLNDYAVLSPLSWLLGAVLLCTYPLARSLDLFALGEARATSMGVAVKPVQILSLVLAIILAASVSSTIGMISFVGLIAPHLAKGSGARSSVATALWSMLWGALLLFGADVVARLLGGDSVSIPAGALTTLLGAPCLLFLLRKKRGQSFVSPSRHQLSLRSARKLNPIVLMLILSLFLVWGIWAHLGYTWPADDVVALRWPRILYALCAGAGLAAAGMILQLFLRNPLASPDITGLTHAGVLCVVLVATVVSGMSQFATIGVSIAGSLIGLIVLLWLNRGVNFSPVRLALTGIALTAIASTITPLVFALSANQSTDALMWLSGTTYSATSGVAITYFLITAILLVLLGLCCRWMNLLSLGDAWALGLGLNVPLSRWLLLLIASLFSGLAVALVGGITFIGLMAPHAARLLGQTDYRYLLPIAALLGATLLIWADFLAQRLLFPFELPTGLLVSILGGIYFIVLLSLGLRKQG